MDEKNLKAKIYWKEKLIALVEVIDGTVKVDIKDERARLYLFDGMSAKDFNKFLSSRVFPNRHDESTADALKELQLPKYDVLEILKKTHGIMLHDNISLDLEV
ncbi:hypothetical protein [Eggerthella sp. YY7918]|uniref:hypothetical protein n=1 Tax=Eggerthella sp. (strain YY7918) TaxID=502558 RepID=UPI00021712FD|nr:hypothetical protein [Eggerthella sp. YY7918]BAK45299.1 hypothetical protein EGYY_22100 [Eggerthella sp. YY7918]